MQLDTIRPANGPNERVRPIDEEHVEKLYQAMISNTANIHIIQPGITNVFISDLSKIKTRMTEEEIKETGDRDRIFQIGGNHRWFAQKKAVDTEYKQFQKYMPKVYVNLTIEEIHFLGNISNAANEENYFNISTEVFKILLQTALYGCWLFLC